MCHYAKPMVFHVKHFFYREIRGHLDDPFPRQSSIKENISADGKFFYTKTFDFVAEKPRGFQFRTCREPSSGDFGGQEIYFMGTSLHSVETDIARVKLFLLYIMVSLNHNTNSH